MIPYHLLLILYFVLMYINNVWTSHTYVFDISESCIKDQVQWVYHCIACWSTDNPGCFPVYNMALLAIAYTTILTPSLFGKGILSLNNRQKANAIKLMFTTVLLKVEGIFKEHWNTRWYFFVSMLLI